MTANPATIGSWQPIPESDRLGTANSREAGGLSLTGPRKLGNASDSGRPSQGSERLGEAILRSERLGAVILGKRMTQGGQPGRSGLLEMDRPEEGVFKVTDRGKRFGDGRGCGWLGGVGLKTSVGSGRVVGLKAGFAEVNV